MANRYAGTPLSSEWDSVQRRRAVNKALLEQAMNTPGGTEFVRGGRVGPTQAVPYSWGTGAAQLGKALIARMGEKKAKEQEQAIAEKYDVNRQRAVDAVVGQIQGTKTPYDLPPEQQMEEGEQIPGLSNAPREPDPIGGMVEGSTNPYLQTPGMQNVISALTAPKPKSTVKAIDEPLGDGTYQRVLYTDGQYTKNLGVPFDKKTPQTNVNVTQETVNKGKNKLIETLGVKQGERLDAQFTQADQAVDLLRSNNEALKLMDEGMVSGSFADVEVGIGKLLNKMGVSYKTDAIENAQAYSAAAAKRVASIIKAFGSGTGLSDQDRIYAEQAAAGDINMDENALRNIIDINRRASVYAITKYNTNAERTIKSSPESAPYLQKIDIPEEYKAGGGNIPDNTPPPMFDDPDKQKRYQEWKARQ